MCVKSVIFLVDIDFEGEGEECENVYIFWWKCIFMYLLLLFGYVKMDLNERDKFFK